MLAMPLLAFEVRAGAFKANQTGGRNRNQGDFSRPSAGIAPLGGWAQGGLRSCSYVMRWGQGTSVTSSKGIHFPNVKPRLKGLSSFLWAPLSREKHILAQVSRTRLLLLTSNQRGVGWKLLPRQCNALKVICEFACLGFPDSAGFRTAIPTHHPAQRVC